MIIVFVTIDQKMAAGRVKSFRRDGSLMRSKSEGTLIDLDNSIFVSHNLNGKTFFFNNIDIIFNCFKIWNSSHIFKPSVILR